MSSDTSPAFLLSGDSLLPGEMLCSENLRLLGRKLLFREDPLFLQRAKLLELLEGFV